ncbi:MAG: hypothetical protein OCU12_07035 [Methanophagales archaeon]|nr:hypothetical protein [Methanophagales archaeon]
MEQITTQYPDVYGYIDYSGPTPHDESGLKNPIYTFKSESEDVYRAYLSFNTAAIPNTATIIAAELELYLHTYDEPIGINVSQYGVQIWYEHDRIGAAVTTDDWGLTGWSAYHSFGANPVLPVQVGVDVGTACVNVSGDSDFELRDGCVWSDTADGPTLHYYPLYGKMLPNKMWLQVTYTLPIGIFNKWNRRLPAKLAQFSGILAAVLLPNGEAFVIQRFAPRRLARAEA